jgi:hypothetical protein
MTTHLRGRRRTLDPAKKAQLCDIVARGASVEEAADDLGVSLRTVQREARRDRDFDHELRLAQRAVPDPLRLMQSAARAHWRAAAWLLERTDPETYGRRPRSSASAEQFEAALVTVIEAALEATPPERRGDVYERARAAADQAFGAIFPAHGPWGRRRTALRPPTPLADREQLSRVARLDDRRAGQPASDEPPAAPAAPAARQRPLAPPRPAARLPLVVHRRLAQPLAAAPRLRAPNRLAIAGRRILSPKIDFATKSPPGHAPPPAMPHSATARTPVK